MRHAELVATIGSQCDSLREAALAAGPNADVPTCPGWTVSRLVGHVARVHSWVLAALDDPTGTDVKSARPPEDWDELIAWWDAQRMTMVDRLADPGTPAWLPWQQFPQVAGTWARRQAHEAAIHRLDAEHARGDVPSSLYDPGFAADGIDELIAWLAPARTDWSTATASGTVVLHATDVERAWTVHLEPGAEPVIESGGVNGDVLIAGTADAVYRHVWGRPSEATVSGDTALLEPLAAP